MDRDLLLNESVATTMSYYGNPRGEGRVESPPGLMEIELNELEALLLSEGINDPFILKAVFMSGGGGSGKGYVSKQMFSGIGLKVVNSDDVLEAFAGNPSLRAKFSDLAQLRPGETYDLGKKADMMSPDVQKIIRPRSKSVAKGFLGNYVKGRLGLIIDSTGRQVEKVGKTQKLLKEAGYDTYMVYVSVAVETAQIRNQMRSRKVDPEVLDRAHAQIRENLGRFKSLFGSNYHEIDNSDISKGTTTREIKGRKYVTTNLEAATTAMRKAGTKLIQGSVKNPKGKEWVMAQHKALELANLARRKKEGSYAKALGRVA